MTEKTKAIKALNLLLTLANSAPDINNWDVKNKVPEAYGLLYKIINK
jgi:hypothetical protein